jgi:hypothetical protein
MAKVKRIKDAEIKADFCETCEYIVPDFTSLSFDKRPILGRCKFQERALLLRSENCKNYKKK